MSETKSDLENIENVILEYLERDSVKDALLLKGDWGSGKTYFLTNRIFDLIRDKLSNSKIIYLSLFGIRSLDKLKSSLVIELLPDKKYKSFLKSGGYSIAIRLIAAKLNIDIANILSSISFSKYLNDDKEYVFVFDDLERLNENLNYDTFLGWINNFIEHNSIKTILIAHESKIKKESYYEYKEKVVGTTVLFSSNEPYEDFLKEYSSDSVLGKYLKAHREIFDYSYNQGCKNNIRIFEFGLKKLKYLLKTLENDIDEKANTKEIQERLILTTMSISLEYKNDAINDSNKDELHVADEHDFDLDLFVGLVEEDENDLRPSIESKYFKRFNYSFSPINEILNLVVNGTFNKKLFAERVLQLADLNKDESERIFDKILNFRVAKSTKALQEDVNKGLEFLSTASYDLKESLMLMDKILKLSDLNLITNDINDLEDQFIETFDSNSESFEYRDQLNLQFNNTTRDYGDSFTNVVQKALDVNQKALDTIRSEIKSDFFTEFLENPSNLKSRVNELGHKNAEIFDEWDVQDTAEHLLKSENEVAIEFSDFIKYRYSGSRGLYENERDFLNQLIEIIERSTDGLDGIKIYNLEKLINQIELFEEMHETVN